MSRVAVLIATHNDGYLLPRALHSLVAQTYRDFKIYVYRDGGEPLPPAAHHALKEASAKLFESDETLGVAYARQFLIDNSFSELIAWQDADDESTPDRLAKQVALLDVQPNLVMVSAWMREVNEKRERIIKTPIDPIECRRWYSTGRQACLNGASMFRRYPVLSKVKLRDFQVGSDFVFNLEIQREFPLMQSNVPEMLYTYHRREDSLVRAHRAAERRGDEPTLEQVCAARIQEFGWQEAML